MFFFLLEEGPGLRGTLEDTFIGGKLNNKNEYST